MENIKNLRYVIDKEVIKGLCHTFDVHAARMFCGRTTGKEEDIREIGMTRKVLQNPSFMALELVTGTVSTVVLVLPKVLTGYAIGSVGTGCAVVGAIFGVGGYFLGSYLRGDDVAYMLRTVKTGQQEQMPVDTFDRFLLSNVPEYGEIGLTNLPIGQGGNNYSTI